MVDFLSAWTVAGVRASGFACQNIRVGLHEQNAAFAGPSPWIVASIWLDVMALVIEASDCAGCQSHTTTMAARLSNFVIAFCTNEMVQSRW